MSGNKLAPCPRQSDDGRAHSHLTRVRVRVRRRCRAEARAWSIPRGATAVEAAGKIHSDLARGFICAETCAYDDYVALGGEAAAKAAGKLRQEGKDYVVADGDGKGNAGARRSLRAC